MSRNPTALIWSIYQRFHFRPVFRKPHVHNQQQTGTQWIKAHLKLVISHILDFRHCAVWIGSKWLKIIPYNLWNTFLRVRSSTRSSVFFSITGDRMKFKKMELSFQGKLWTSTPFAKRTWPWFQIKRYIFLF